MARYFDGVDDYIEIQGYTGVVNPMTVMGWFIKLETTTKGLAIYSERGDGRSYTSSGFFLAVSSDNYLVFIAYGVANIVTNVQISLNQLYHYAVTVSSSRVVSFYLNGELAYSATLPANIIAASSNGLINAVRAASNYPTPTAYCSGIIS